MQSQQSTAYVKDITALLDKVVSIVKDWLIKRKVGSVTINFFKGGVSSVRFEETIKIADHENVRRVVYEKTRAEVVPAAGETSKESEAKNNRHGG